MDTKLLKEKLFDIMSKHTDFGISLISPQGYFLYYNKAMGEIEGVDGEEILGRHVFDIFPSYNMDNSSIFKCLGSGEPIYDSLQSYINFKGKKITSIVTDIPLYHEKEIYGVVEIVRSVERMEELYRAIEGFGDRERPKKASREPYNNNTYYDFDDFITADPQMIRLLERAKKMAKIDSNVLIYGETGTGKEIIAQSIHNSSKRSREVFVAQNCAALPENLMESLVFGAIKGSFTGAANMKGLFELAQGGSLLLDELSSFPVHLQAKLLRTLQEKTVRRLGDVRERKVDVRVIATINETPEELMDGKHLREDLFFRLSAMYISLPPLRERPGDIRLLIEHFSRKLSEDFDIEKPVFSRELMDFFDAYQWKGNVRELINVVKYILLNNQDREVVELVHLPHYLQRSPGKISSHAPFSEKVEDHERELILEALKEEDWNIKRSADRLGLKRQTLQNKMKRLEIEKP